MTRTRKNAQHGFSLIELMIALALSSVVAAATLGLVRSQLNAYELNDSVMKAQQNARAGLEFIETQLRRACGGVSEGRVAINVPGVTPASNVPCLKIWDSAATLGATFSNSGTTGADAIEVIYGASNGSGLHTTVATVVSLTTTTPSITVNDLTGFVVGDFVMLTDFAKAELYKIVTINGGASAATGSGSLGFGTLSAVPQHLTGFVAAPGTSVIKAQSLSLYVVAGTGLNAGQLYYDPDGVAGTGHTDAQPLVDGVADFQLALGADWQAAAPSTGTASDGVISESGAPSANNDEWIGNVAGETWPTPPWNVTATPPFVTQIRSTLVVRTSNSYPSAISNLGPFEDGATITASVSGGRYPRYRVMRSIVAPREWNLGE